jgi:serine/threonine protein kinase
MVAQQLPPTTEERWNLQTALKLNNGSSFQPSRPSSNLKSPLNFHARKMQAVICVLSRMEHPNLVTFLGYCHERNNKCLCFELMTNGSLEERLHGKLGNHVWF